MYTRNINQYLIPIFALIAIISIWFWSKNKTKKEQTTGSVVLGDTSSTMSNNDIEQIGYSLREFFENSLLTSFSDYSQLIATCAKIKDEGAVLGIAQVFGIYDSWFMGSGGLAYWMNKLPDNIQNEVRPRFYGALLF